jgi:hypothetical protein
MTKILDKEKSIDLAHDIIASFKGPGLRGVNLLNKGMIHVGTIYCTPTRNKVHAAQQISQAELP